MRKLLLLQLLAVSYAAYTQPVQEDYEEYGGGGGGGVHNGGPSIGGGNGYGKVAPGAREPLYEAPVQSSHGSDGEYDVAEEWKPYAFSYTAQDPEGSHSHQQQADSKNRVTGQYSIMMADGRHRIVKYVADENGFRAEIVTNEQGTESKNPADVTIQSSAPTGEEAAKQHSDSYANNLYEGYDAAPGSKQTPHAGGHGSVIAPPSTIHSDSETYAKQDSQSYTQQNNHPASQSYSHDHSNYQSRGYSTNSEYSHDYHQQRPAAGPSGGYGNEISDVDDHEEKEYYSGTGSRGVGRSKPSYGR